MVQFQQLDSVKSVFANIPFMNDLNSVPRLL